MTGQQYNTSTKPRVGEIKVEHGIIHIKAGNIHGETKGRYLPMRIMDLDLEEGSSMTIEADPEETIFLFLIENGALVEDRAVTANSVVVLDEGEIVTVDAPETTSIHMLLCSARPLGNPFIWGHGPMVLATGEEMEQGLCRLEKKPGFQVVPGGIQVPPEVPGTVGEPEITVPGPDTIPGADPATLPLEPPEVEPVQPDESPVEPVGKAGDDDGPVVTDDETELGNVENAPESGAEPGRETPPSQPDPSRSLDMDDVSSAPESGKLPDDK